MSCCCDGNQPKSGVLLSGDIPAVSTVGVAGAASSGKAGEVLPSGTLESLSWWQQFAKLPAWARVAIAVVVIGGVVYIVRGN